MVTTFCLDVNALTVDAIPAEAGTPAARLTGRWRADIILTVVRISYVPLEAAFYLRQGGSQFERGHSVISGYGVFRMATKPYGRAAVACLALLLVAGCGRGRYEVAPLDEEQARETLNDALESWKQGESQDSLQERSPPILAQDPDWMSGVKLLDYEFVDAGEEVDGRLVSHVKLKLLDDRGGQGEKTVTYLVNTNPGLTVLRDIRQ